MNANHCHAILFGFCGEKKMKNGDKKNMQYRCARCGRPIDIHRYVQNLKMFLILNQEIALHFCNYCKELVNRSEK